MDKIRDIYNMFTDIWKLYRKYYNRLNTDDDWEAVIEEVGATNKKYNTLFCRELLVCLLNEFDRLEKERRSGHEGNGI